MNKQNKKTQTYKTPRDLILMHTKNLKIDREEDLRIQRLDRDA